MIIVRQQQRQNQSLSYIDPVANQVMDQVDQTGQQADSYPMQPERGRNGLLSVALLSLPLSMMLGLAGCQTTTVQVDGIKRDPLVADPIRAAQTRVAMAAELLKQGKLDQAQQAAERALEAEPNFPEANNIMALILQTEGSPRNLAKAEVYFRQALAQRRDFPQARNNYGVFLFQQQRYAEAMSQLEIAATTLGYDNRGAALENLGQVALRLGQTERATQAFTQALRVNANSVLARQGMADILLRRNQVTQAAALYAELEALQATGTPDALWLGIKLARAQLNTRRQNELISRLREQFPNSAEYQRYQQLASRPGVPWD